MNTEKDSLSVQVGPAQPGAHTHSNPVDVSRQLPPLWQGSERQACSATWGQKNIMAEAAAMPPLLPPHASALGTPSLLLLHCAPARTRNFLAPRKSPSMLTSSAHWLVPAGATAREGSSESPPQWAESWCSETPNVLDKAWIGKAGSLYPALTGNTTNWVLLLVKCIQNQPPKAGRD